MKVTLLLADAAQAAEGKLYVLGGGLSITGPHPSPLAPQANCEIGNDHHEDNPEPHLSQMLHYVHGHSISPPTPRRRASGDDPTRLQRHATRSLLRGWRREEAFPPVVSGRVA